MMHFFKRKYQSLVDSLSKANRYVQGKYKALKDTVSNIKHFIQDKIQAVKTILSNIKKFVKAKYQAVIAIPSKIKTSIQKKYHAFKDSVTRKKNYLVHQYKRFRASRFVRVNKSILKFLYSYSLPISGSFMLTGLMSSLRMPAYMMLLQYTGDPLSASLTLEACLLMPGLVGTKAYRVSKALYQKYVMKIQPVEPVPEKIIQKAVVPEIELEFEEIAQPEVQASALVLPKLPQAEAQIEDYQNANQFTKPEFTTFRSNLKHNKSSAELMLTGIDEEQDEHDSGVDIDGLEKNLKQSWSFQDKEPKAQAPVLVLAPQASALVLPEIQQQSEQAHLQDPLAVHPAAIVQLRSSLKRSVSFNLVDDDITTPVRKACRTEESQDSVPVSTRSSSRVNKRERAEPFVPMVDKSVAADPAPDADSNKRRRSIRA